MTRPCTSTIPVKPAPLCWALLSLLGLAFAACSKSPATSEPSPAAVAAVSPRATATFTPAEAPLADLVPDVARLDQVSNPQRQAALQEMLSARGLDFAVQAFPNPSPDRDPRGEGHNIVVSVGSGEKSPIVVGAHYDASRLPDGSLVTGAVDNGAGSIVLTRVAEALARQPLSRRVQVVFFDMEEIGLIGSKAFVASLDPARVAAMINVDVAAYGDAVVYGPAVHDGNTELYAAIKRVCGRLLITCVEFPAYPPSDDRSFQRAGIPNISIGIQPRAEAYQLWLALNGGAESGLQSGFLPRALHIIHTPEDKVVLVEPAAMTLAYNAVTSLVLELDRTLP